MVTSYPGVYVQEDTSGVRPIEGVTTSTAAFIGLTEKGPVDRALLVTSFRDFQTKFGRLLRGSWLACSVMQFFGNGGRRLYIARVDDRPKTPPTEIQFQKAFALLDPVKDILLVAVPGYGTPSMVGCGASYCRKRGDCFFIGDMGPGDITRRRATVFMDRIAVKSSYAAVYLPWLKIQNPEEASPKVIEVPPSGSVAGVHARIDAKRGVWKAAAGTEAAIHGAIGLSANIAERDQDALNAVGANVIRYSENLGVLIWGSRTLSAQYHADYRYVSVRRTAIFIEQSIENGIRWAVFEPNGEALWKKVRLHVGAFMYGLFRQGALQGTTQRQAYFVKCDRETNTQSDIALGIVNIVIGFAPLKPAEFLVLKVSQKTAPAAQV